MQRIHVFIFYPKSHNAEMREIIMKKIIRKVRLENLNQYWGPKMCLLLNIEVKNMISKV